MNQRSLFLPEHMLVHDRALVLGAQDPSILGVGGSQPKHVSNPDSVIKTFKPPVIYDCISGHVPKAFVSKYPRVKITRSPDWASTAAPLPCLFQCSERAAVLLGAGSCRDERTLTHKKPTWEIAVVLSNYIIDL